MGAGGGTGGGSGGDSTAGDSSWISGPCCNKLTDLDRNSQKGDSCHSPHRIRSFLFLDPVAFRRAGIDGLADRIMGTFPGASTHFAKEKIGQLQKKAKFRALNKAP